MTLKVVRTMRLEDSTRGHLYLDGGYVCDTLEPKWRDYAHGEKKVPNHSAIPAGTYMFRIAHSPKRGMDVIWINDVPNFNAIQIHIGNYPSNTQGCILVGFGTGYEQAVYQSTICFNYLMGLIKHRTHIGMTVGKIIVSDEIIV